MTEGNKRTDGAAGNDQVLTRGRSSRSNGSGRFEAVQTERVHDGWGDQDPEVARAEMTLTADHANSILSHNGSRNIGFDAALQPASKHRDGPYLGHGIRDQERAARGSKRQTVVLRRRARLMQPLERLYHLAEPDNLPSIREHGLMSTEKLLGLIGMPDDERAAWLRQHRPNSVRLSDGVLIRDQRPMPPNALARALVDGLSPADWYALLNRHVFLWPGRDRMELQRNACGDRPQVLLTFDGKALLERYGSEALVSPITPAGEPRTKSRRSREARRSRPRKSESA